MVFPDGAILLILDTSAVHRSAQVRAIARHLGIDLIFIPSGCTDQMQPLDRSVFGVLKADARRIWRGHYHRPHAENITKAMVADRLIEARNRITSETIESDWEIFGPFTRAGEPADDDGCDRDDDEYRQLINIHGLMDLSTPIQLLLRFCTMPDNKPVDLKKFACESRSRRESVQVGQTSI